MNLLLLLGSTWSPPSLVTAAWVATGGGVEVTPALGAAACSTRFELHDDVNRLAWVAAVPTNETATIDAVPPTSSSATGRVLLLTADVSCVDSGGQVLGEVRLAGIRVRVEQDGSLVDLGPLPRHGDALLIDAPIGTWTVSTSRPGFQPDDDAPEDIEEEEVR